MSKIRRAKPSTAKNKPYCFAAGKARYATRKAAAGSSNFVSRKFDKKISFYKCPFCRGYHLTSQVKDGKETGQTE